MLGLDDAVPGFELGCPSARPSCAADRGARGAARRTRGYHAAGPPASDRPLPLIVDDSAVNRVVASALAQSLGYEVQMASDGKEALPLCERTPPAVVLMDVDMDPMEARGHPPAARASAARRDLALDIVAATSDANEDTRRRCAEAGMEGFLTKPLRLQLLRAELRRVGVSAAAS